MNTSILAYRVWGLILISEDLEGLKNVLWTPNEASKFWSASMFFSTLQILCANSAKGEDRQVRLPFGKVGDFG